MRYFALSDIGKVRRENQDAWREYSDPEQDALAIVVCDGMGGAAAGSTASTMAAESCIAHLRDCLTMPERKSPGQMLLDAVSYANLRLYNQSFLDPELRGMGTTLVALLILGSTCTVVNVGDSRCYVLDPESGLRQVTADHSFVAELLAQGKITPEQAKRHPKRNIITRALGMELELRSDIFHLHPASGARILLCTDGLTNLLSDEEIGECLLVHTEPEACCRVLVDTALRRGAPDNVTAAVLFTD